MLLLVSIVSCKKTAETKEENTPIEAPVAEAKMYPENLTKIFDAHGGLDKWNAMQTLKFTVVKEKGNEVVTTDLKSRTAVLEMPNHNVGFSGEEFWVQYKDTMTYKGNPRFSYNLMFYFYAMPFILADDGINYGEAEPLKFDGKEYPGILISYGDGVGESPEDEYILYYDPETYQMTWLGYTVTFFSKEKSKEFHFRKYSNWQTIDGLILPETQTSYKSENNIPTEKRGDQKFIDVEISKDKLDASFFGVPEGAIINE